VIGRVGQILAAAAAAEPAYAHGNMAPSLQTPARRKRSLRWVASMPEAKPEAGEVQMRPETGAVHVQVAPDSGAGFWAPASPQADCCGWPKLMRLAASDREMLDAVSESLAAPVRKRANSVCKME
jgi:hypothetical protein